MKVKHYSDIPAKEFGETAPNTSIRVLIDDKNDNAPVYNLRMIEIGVNGNILSDVSVTEFVQEKRQKFKIRNRNKKY